MVIKPEFIARDAAVTRPRRIMVARDGHADGAFGMWPAFSGAVAKSGLAEAYPGLLRHDDDDMWAVGT